MRQGINDKGGFVYIMWTLNLQTRSIFAHTRHTKTLLGCMGDKFQKHYGLAT
jgi:hypothetical protein